jgi:hypothetical protein
MPTAPPRRTNLNPILRDLGTWTANNALTQRFAAEGQP